MSALMGFYETIGRLLSRKQVRDIEKSLGGAGITVAPEAFIGFFFVICTLISFFAFLLMLNDSTVPRFLYALFGLGFVLPDYLYVLLTFIVAFAAVFLSISLLVWVWVSLQSEARKMAVEAVLPDFLSLMAGNVRSGMTLDQAMWYAAKPEFGLFSIEVRKVVKNAFSGEPIEKSLDRLDMRFNSRVLHRTILLIKQALATGGEVAEILEETAEDAREVRIHKQDIAATLIVYIIFLVFAATIGAPFLFSVATNLIGILAMAFSYIPSGGVDTGSMPVSFFVMPRAPAISVDEFYWFSIALVFITAAMSSMLLGIVQGGSKTQGLKYFPFMLVVSYIIYFIVGSFLNSMFSSMLF
ncbi:MAG: type II secretion system F family protein [Candidatus Bilamarchaeaceae archaeon]